MTLQMILLLAPLFTAHLGSVNEKKPSASEAAEAT